MSTLTQKQRDALPAADFGDPKNRKFPILDQSDVDAAAHLIGKADDPAAVKRRIIAIAKRKGLKVPDAWQSGKGDAVGVEYKTFGLTDPQFDDSGPGAFAGYTSLWDVKDSGGDIVLKGAYTKTLPQFIERGFVSWNHDWGNPVATIKAAYEDAKGLFIEADFHSDPVAQQARIRTQERVQRGKFMGLSIGYRPAPGGAERTKDARLLKELDLFESGLVTVPMLATAGVIAAKANGPAGYDAEPPEGSYEELAEDLAEAYAAANGLDESRVLTVATFPGYAILCVYPDFTQDGPTECEYWQVPYTVGGDDDALTLGMPAAVDPQLTYVPSEDAKGLLLPLVALQAETKALDGLKAGARHSKPTRERYAAMEQHVAAARLHLTALSDHIGSLQAESVPADASKAGAALYGEYLAFEARRLGVAV